MCMRVCECIHMLQWRSQIGHVQPVQRRQHAAGSQKAMLHDGEALQQLLP